MKVVNNTNTLMRVSEVRIPDIYNRRFKTGKEDLDAVFGGQGFLPGMSFTLAAGPGTGKTTMLIQMLELLEKTGKKTAYISGEESVEQLAFNCKRLGVQNVSVGNLTVIEDIFDLVAKSRPDIIILDSIPSFVSRKKLRGRALEEYLSNYIVSKAKEYECVVGVILHFTKAGTYKGSTLLPHSVDCNIMMSKSKDNPVTREVVVTKNRFGVAGFSAFMMHEYGFDFKRVDTESEDSEDEGQGEKKTKGEKHQDKLLKAIEANKRIKMEEAVKILGNSSQAYVALRDLTLKGTLTKKGKGTSAVWHLN